MPWPWRRETRQVPSTHHDPRRTASRCEPAQELEASIAQAAVWPHLDPSCPSESPQRWQKCFCISPTPAGQRPTATEPQAGVMPFLVPAVAPWAAVVPKAVVSPQPLLVKLL